MAVLISALLLSIVTILTEKSSGFLLPCRKSIFPCGRPAINPDGQKIIGGRPAQRGSWPWLVLIVQDGYAVCGGAIISERIILTATHCFMGRSNDMSRWKVVAGKTRLDRHENAQQMIGVKKMILHKNYNISTLENDIAILVLSGDLPFSTLIQPICIPTADKGVTTGEMCLMAGWGDTKGTGDQLGLNQVAVPVIADDVCSKHEWYGAEFHGEKTFCAGYEEGGKDACHGDSGGPLICRDGNKWVIQGIASWGIECGVYRWPGIYTEVSKFASWIQDQIDQEKMELCGL